MVSFVSDGARAPCDREGARPEFERRRGRAGTNRSLSSCRIAFDDLEFCRRESRRHERAHRGDLLLRRMRNMNGILANGRCVGVVAGRRVLRPDDAAVACCAPGLADCVVGMAARRKRRHRWSNMNVQSRMTGQVAEAGNCGGMRIVRKLLTFGGQAVCGRTEAIELSSCRVLPGRFEFDRVSLRQRRRVVPGAFTAVGLSIAGSRIFVQRRAARWTRSTVDLRMLRSGDNGLQTVVADAVLPNYWANCLLIQQQLLVVCVAEDGRAGAQWRPECPC